MNKFIKEREKLRRNLIVDGLLVGIVAGTASLLYRYVLSILDDIRKGLYIWDLTHIIGLIVLAIVIGLTMGFILKIEPLSGGSGIPQIQGEILGYFKMNPLRVLFSKFTGGSLGNLIGMSLGREGPSIQIGASAGKALSKALKKNISEEKYIISAGASAGLSAAFNAPLAGTLFTLEEMHRNFSPLIFIPSVIAAVTADFLSKYVFGLKPVFSFKANEVLPLNSYWIVIIIGIATALVGSLFSISILKCQDLYKKIEINKIYKPIIAALITLGAGFTFYDILGGGHHLLESISEGKYTLSFLLAILLMKLFLTVICFSSGAQGGIFLPLLVLGGITGAAVFKATSFIIGDKYMINFIIIAMAGILTAVVRSPILSIILVTEMTGSFTHVLGLTFVSVITYLLCEHFKIKPIYESLLIRQIENYNQINGIEEPKEKPDKKKAGDKIIDTFVVAHDSKLARIKLKDVKLPEESLIINVRRGEYEFTPKGGFTIHPSDELTFIMREKDTEEIRDLVR